MKTASLFHLRFIIHVLIGISVNRITMRCDRIPVLTYIMLYVAFVIDGALARAARSYICAISCAFEFKLLKSKYSTFARSAVVCYFVMESEWH